MQVMMERNKEYLAKQTEGAEKEAPPEEEEKEKKEQEQEQEGYPQDEDEEGKDEGDVWGHDGWDKMMHDSNPRRRYNKQAPEAAQSTRKEEANRYVPPRLRSVPRQEQWLKEREEKTQIRAREKEQIDAEQEAKNKERAQRKRFIQPLYVPPNRKAAQAQKEAQAQEPTTPTKEEEGKISEESVKTPEEKHAPQQEKPSEKAEKEKKEPEKEVEEEEEGEEEGEEEFDEEEEEGDEDEEEEDEEEEEEDVLLILRLEISHGVTKSLKVRKGDKPEEVAALFCKTHGIADAKLRVIINTIETNLKQNT